MRSQWRFWGRVLLDFVYPPHCLVCGRALEEAREYLCAPCWEEVGVSRPRRCRRCSCPQAEEVDGCENCAGWEGEFERVLVLGDFGGVLQQAVHALKFRGHGELGRALGRRLGRMPEFAGLLEKVDWLVPVPLHPARQRERGYNQSRFIAEGVAEMGGKRVEEGLLRRVRHTRQQAKLELEERRVNLLGAFRVEGEMPEGECAGVVDDVVTTGATLAACARTLRRAGVRRVWGLALASPFRTREGALTWSSVDT